MNVVCVSSHLQRGLLSRRVVVHYAGQDERGQGPVFRLQHDRHHITLHVYTVRVLLLWLLY